MKKLFFVLFSCFVFINFAFADNGFDAEIIKVRIENITEKSCESFEFTKDTCRVLELRGLTGSVKGKIFTIDFSQDATVSQIASDSYQKGQIYYAEYSKKIDGSDLIFLQSIERLPAIYLLILLFFLLIILFGRKQGFYAVVGMIISFFILIFVAGKGILSGTNVYFVTFSSALLIMLFTLYLTYGFNKKTHSAFIGSFFTLLITFVLGYVFISLTKLTGFGSEESTFLKISENALNMRDILFAGIVIGALGVLDDVTIGQASAVFQIAKTDSSLNWKQVYKRAIVIGKDHVASMVNTLIIAYAGASFPLFLLFIQESGVPFSYILNSEIVSEEIVRMLVGSIGILIAVPLTTLIASKMAKMK